MAMLAIKQASKVAVLKIRTMGLSPVDLYEKEGI
jgi:hypothetical protein